MEQELLKRIEILEEWKRQMEFSSTIPLEIDQSYRKRFSVPVIVKIPLDFPNANAQTSSSLTANISGAAPGDLVVITPASNALIGNLGGIFVGYVNALNTVTIRFINPDTSSALNPPNGIFTIAVFKQ
jgi:hypothetical protein